MTFLGVGLMVYILSAHIFLVRLLIFGWRKGKEGREKNEREGLGGFLLGVKQKLCS